MNGYVLVVERMPAEGVFLWVGEQVLSLVSKYVKGLDGGVEEPPCTNTATGQFMYSTHG